MSETETRADAQAETSADAQAETSAGAQAETAGGPRVEGDARRRAEAGAGSETPSEGLEAPGEGLETVALELRDGGVARIALNRPQALNAWNQQLGLDLRAALRRVGELEEVRAVVLTGSGRAFSSGADLKDFSGGELTPDGRPDVYKTLTERYHPIMHAVRELPKPVIAAVGGAAVGIGCSLALCCDLIVAAESAYFLLAFVNIGLVPDGGSSLFVPSRVGMARASEMALLGERVGAAQALDWGLVNRVVADERLEQEAAALARRLAAGPTRAYAGAKRQLNAWLYARMAEQLELEAQIQREMAGSEDFVEGALAFLQKRAPRFEGR
jgi:2-(1,2-epoxy-1,2-dihydrophenyl)acetyl-CoA isomerase